MAWNGDIRQDIRFVRAIDGTTCEIEFGCGHKQLLRYPLEMVLGKLRATVCAQCSKPMWDKIGAIRDRISFEDVLEAIRSKE